MPTIQSAEIWKESGRYNDYGEEMLRITDRQGKEMLYGTRLHMVRILKEKFGKM